MPFLDLPSHRMHYQIDGGHDRPWLVFCNSLGTDLTMWDPQIAGLSQQFRILRYDRRGHGLSDAPPAPYAIGDLGGDVLALMAALGIEKAHFCGLSIGGLTGLWLAQNAAQHFDRMVLCATAAKIGTAESWQARARDVAQSGLAPLRAATAERWFTPAFTAQAPAQVDDILTRFTATTREGYIGCCAALAAADLRAGLADITLPVMTIAGQDDPVCPPADLEQIARNVQQGQSLALSGRHIVNIEAAAAFNQALAAFLT